MTQKADDTVLTPEGVLAKLRELTDDEWLDVMKDLHGYERKLQAKASFEAGKNEGWAEAETHYGINTGYSN